MTEESLLAVSRTVKRDDEGDVPLDISDTDSHVEMDVILNLVPRNRSTTRYAGALPQLKRMFGFAPVR